jgi:hypothetical protein
MTVYPLCDPFVWENPKVMLNTGFTIKYHAAGDCASEIVNHILLMYILAFMLGSLISVGARVTSAMPVLMGIATLYCMPSFWKLITFKRSREGFTDAASSSGSGDPAAAAAAAKEEQKYKAKNSYTEVYDVIGMGAAPATLTLPSTRNPFMNVLIDEIKYNPRRPMAASVMDPSVKVSLDEFFRTEFNSDPTDVFGKTQSQRQFITMPSTGIPNDQESYQNWLYKIPGKTCKEGGREACLPGTDGGVIPWLNVTP